jgi:hypothetical protein
LNFAATLGVLFDGAEDRFAKGELMAARSMYSRFVLDLLAAGDPVSVPVLLALDRLADIGVLLGEYDQAQQFLTKIETEFKAAQNAWAVDFTALKRASVAIGRAQFWVARQILEDLSLPPRRHLDLHPSDASEAAWDWNGAGQDERALLLTRYYLEVGRWHAGMGRYELAAMLLRFGLMHSASPPTREAEIPLLLALASAHLERGDLLSAGGSLGALPTSLGNSNYLGYAIEELELSAKIDMLRGNLGQAKQTLQRVVELCSARFERARMQTQLNLAYTLILLNQTSEAGELCRDVRRRAILVGDESLRRRSEFLNHFAIARGQSMVSSVGMASPISVMWGAIESEAPRSKCGELNPFDLPPQASFLNLFEERALGFYWHLGRFDWKAARTYLKELEQIFSETDSLLIKARLMSLDCILAYYERRFVDALHGFEAAITVVRKLGLKPELSQLIHFREWCQLRIGNDAMAREAAQEAKELDDSIEASLAEADRIVFQLNKWTKNETYLAGEVDQLIRMKGRLESKGWRSAISKPLLRLRMATRVASLLDYAELSRGSAVDMEEQGFWRTKLWLPFLRHPRQRVSLSFLVLPDRILTFKIGFCSLDFGQTPVTRIQLRTAVRSYHEAAAKLRSLEMTSDGRSPSERMRDLRSAAAARRDAMRFLSSALRIAEVTAALPTRISSLTFIPDDVLHGVPFAALELRSGIGSGAKAGRYLIECFAISVSDGWRAHKRSKPKEGEAVAIPLTRSGPGVAPLPNAMLECQAVTNLMRAASIAAAIETDFKKATLLERIAKIRFLHIATHGWFDPYKPDQSGLLMVDADNTGYRVTIRDISKMAFSGLELAVLSGCWSADNFVAAPKRVIGLPQILLAAGAHSVVGSLWRINDALAPRFMERFYREACNGIPLDVALQRAQIACLRRELGNDSNRFHDSRYWAPFLIYGDARPLRLGS